MSAWCIYAERDTYWEIKIHGTKLSISTMLLRGYLLTRRGTSARGIHHFLFSTEEQSVQSVCLLKRSFQYLIDGRKVKHELTFLFTIILLFVEVERISRVNVDMIWLRRRIKSLTWNKASLWIRLVLWTSHDFWDLLCSWFWTVVTLLV